MFRISLTLALFTFGCLAGYSQKNEVYFPYFELINLEQDGELQYSTTRLLKTYVESSNEYYLVIPSHDRITYLNPVSTEESLNAARQENAEFLLTGEIHNLDGSFIVSLSVFDAKTGEKKWSDLIKGVSSEDIDPLLSRLGRTFMTKTKARDDIEIGEVSEYEQKGIELQQIKANHYFGVMVGGNTILGERTLSGFGLAYSFDASSVIFNVNFDYYFSSQSLDSELQADKMELGSFNLGLMYPMSRKRNTWFLSGGMDYSFVEIYQDSPDFNPDRTGGVGLLVGGGYLINRNSTVNLRIHSSLYFPTYDMIGGYQPSIKFGLTTSIAK